MRNVFFLNKTIDIKVNKFASVYFNVYRGISLFQFFNCLSCQVIILVLTLAVMHAAVWSGILPCRLIFVVKFHIQGSQDHPSLIGD